MISHLFPTAQLLDHKPDNMIVTGKKYKLKGVACLGRPGVALCIGQRPNIDKFLVKMQRAMPQKKFSCDNIELVDYDEDLNNLIDGFEEVPLATLRELLTSIGHEDKLLALVGIAPSRSSQSNENQNNLDNSKKDRKKKRRKR